MGNRKRWIGAGVLCLALGLTLTFTVPARSQRPPVVSNTLTGQIAAATRLDEKDVDKVLRELGPAITARVARGERVEIPGLGLFRVVRVPEHKDLVDGRPAVIAARNYVEFLPVDALVGAANAPTAVPAVIVPPFEYHPLPNQTPGQKVPDTRQPNVRIR